MVIAVASLAIAVDLDARSIARRSRIGGPDAARGSRGVRVARGARPAGALTGSTSPTRRRRNSAARRRRGPTDRRPPQHRRLPSARGQVHRARRALPEVRAGDARCTRCASTAPSTPSPTPGWARACCTCCASGSACPAPKAGCEQGECGSCSVLVDGRCSCALPRARRRRGRHRDHDRRRAAAARTGRAERRAAGFRRDGRGAVRLLHARLSWRCTTCSTASPRPTISRCARRSRATCAAAPATAGFSKPSTPSRDARPRSRRVTDVDVGTRVAGRHRPSARSGPTASPRCAASSRSPAICGPRACSGARRCAPRIRRRVSVRSTSVPRWRSRACTRCSPRTTCPLNRYGLEHRDQPVLAGDVVRYIGRAGRRRRRRAPRDRAARVRGDRRRLRDPRSRRRPRGARVDAPLLHPDGNVFRDLVIRRGDPDVRGPVVGRGHLRDRHAGPGVHGPGGRAGHPRRRRRRRPRRVDAVVAQRPRPGLGVPRDAARAGASVPRRGGRRVRRPRRREPAHSRVPARGAHRPAGEDRLLPRGVVPRSRAPPPRPHLDAPHARSRRRDRQLRGAHSSSTAAPTARRATT